MEYLRSGYQDLTYSFNYAWAFTQNYAWYMIFGGLVLYYVSSKFLRPVLESVFGTYENYKKTKEEWEYNAKYHKDPDLFASRISSQQAYVQKLQEKYEQEVKDHQAKLKEKQEQKRQEAERLLSQQGHRLGGHTDNDDSKPKSLRPEYNPLMGPGSSNYRPPKRSKCGGGGCGK